MIDIFQSVARFFKLKQFCVDNNVFRLHYKFTVGALILFSIVVSAYQFFGNPVRCINTSIRQEAVETFCWAHATYSLPDAFEKEYGEEVPYPGVENYYEGKERVFHSYYQWVCFILLLQAVMFAVPHYLWKTWEGGRIKHIVLNLDSPILDNDTKEKEKSRLVRYLTEHLKLHAPYVTAYVTCEVLNFINIVGQIFLIDRFLGYTFSNYGVKVAQYTAMDVRKRPDVMTYVFPKVTKCTFHVFGSGGSVEKVDTLCILPLNIINEKIYVFIWFWFIFLSVISAGMLLYRILTLTSAQARYFALLTRCTRVDRNSLQAVLSKCHVGDWFVLNLISKNVEPNNFKDLISALAKELEKGAANRLLYIHNGDNKLSGYHL